MAEPIDEAADAMATDPTVRFESFVWNGPRSGSVSEPTNCS